MKLRKNRLQVSDCSNVLHQVAPLHQLSRHGLGFDHAAVHFEDPPQVVHVRQLDQLGGVHPALLRAIVAEVQPPVLAGVEPSASVLQLCSRWSELYEDTVTLLRLPVTLE